ncbi:hypothetical protein HED60_14215 [Planctomycetales bacterium ZRK34]|nr:hypothetical protein HED60_14215 [Planctomycetales bacterium ZRK34]
MGLSSAVHSERRRRVLVAVLMGLLLAATTAVAMWVSRGKAPAKLPSLVAQTVGVFKFERPSSWAPTTESSTSTPNGASTVSFEQRDAATAGQTGEREMTAAELRFARPVLPNAAMGAVMQKMVRGMAQLRGTWPVRIGSMTGLLGQADLLDTDQQFRSLMLAVITIDGRRYFALSLSSTHLGDPIDALLTNRIIHSVVDRRYAAMNPPVQLADALTLRLPAGLTALRPAGEAGQHALIVTPTQSLRYFLTSMNVIDLPTVAEQLAASAQQVNDAGQTEVPEALMQMIQRMPEADPTVQVETMVTLQYWKLRGQLPTPGSGAAVDLAGRPTRAMLITSGRGAEPYQSIWGMKIDDRRMILMELIAEPTAAGQVQAEARAIVSGLELSTAPASNSDDTADTANENPEAPR